ncbi:hypothetical protein KFE25_006207 [Diacronema lutheri]|uniref:Fatty acid desaturase domain-containing protein n=1 Tax=Diacronema lutheri TaxID=2081491 RepID=A0A7R9YMG6_DIALT|nr:hypothetical protein KFE25_006207 [Diacronema lutheri]|mmetsp:Transcript_5725/g.18003  ORF Transcript_5725/g.18003 Transcript_5725/m.18003 type:complete len:361 (+) Transcript_5725:62-1144(+)
MCPPTSDVPVVAGGERVDPACAPMTLQDIRKVIPQECFVKDTGRSLWFLARDLAVLATAPLVYPHVAASANPLLYLAYWNFYGFFMWALFVVGHDCGHTTFSNSKLLNDVCGHIAHAPLLVPYYPWAMSHRRHHMYHNHQKKDASHPWFTKASMPKLPAFTRSFLKSPLAPFLAYPIYLFEGSFDGSHVFPLSKLYRGASTRAKLECAVSTATVLAFGAAAKLACGSWATLALAYGGCYACFTFWLFMVTYFQHHDHGTLVYDDADWSYLKGALQTIDRTYGFGLDSLHHNISDGHVVHHLFFTQVPHYHLTKATEHVAPFLAKAGVYKKVVHDNYLKDFWRTFLTCNFTGWKWANGKAN